MGNNLESPNSGGGMLKWPYSWRREDFGPEVNRLFERYTEGDPQVELVSMNNGKSIEVGPDDEEKVIFAFALGGCYGVAVFIEQGDGRRKIVLTHYDATQISRNMIKLRELLGQSGTNKEAKTKQSVIVMASGQWQRDSQTKRWKLDTAAEDQQRIEGIIASIRAELGDVEVRVEPYDTKTKWGAKDEGTMIVRVPPKDRGRASFQTWFSAGKFGSEK